MKKLLNKYVWTLLTIFFAIAFIIFIVGEGFVRENEGNINYGFGINPYERVDVEDAPVNNEFPSPFVKADGTLDDAAMRANSMEISRKAAGEGAVLLWNNDNALPLKSGAKISFFGVSCMPNSYMYTGQGSGSVSVRTSDFLNLKDQFQSEGKFTVNDKLWNSYTDSRAWAILSDPNGDDKHYREFTVNEKAWSQVNSAAGSSFSSFGDAAIYILSRTGAEDGDTWFDTSKNTKDGHLENNYLDLTKNEVDTLNALQELRRNGTFKSLILVLNTGTPMQMKHISEYDIDACLWAGMGGNASFAALYDVMSGAADPSGRLVDTYAYDGNSAPSTVNTGAFEFTESGSLPAENRSSNTYNHAYIVYEEGVYVGYRYYETRYEDTVMKTGNANGKAGAVMSKNSWSYSDEVRFPFGYGLSYTTFEFSDYSVKSAGGDDYEVSVTVKNTGSVAGKTPVQIYLQKPYTDYDKDERHPVEKPAAELVGFGKTGLIEAGGSETVTVKVRGRDFASYDSYGKKSYILEAGDYYLAFGTDVHDAVNNILAAKGFDAGDGMVDSLGQSTDGEAGFAHKITIGKGDSDKYAYSEVNKDVKITNRFDDADVKLYDGTRDQVDAVTYLSRRDWQGTYPDAPVAMKARNRVFVNDMQYSGKLEEDPAAVMPKFGETTNTSGPLTLIMLKDLDYSNPLWEDLLNQLTWEEVVNLCGNGSHIINACQSVSSPPVVAQDGPAGVKGDPPASLGSYMSFPCGVVLASTWNEEVVEDVCDAFGLEMKHANVGEIYGTGAGMHRSVYGGRNWEYFSEDPFISGRTLCAEVKGLQSRGAIVNIKHFALNDQEIYRCGITTWANEQSIREIYLKAFEAAIIEGHANGVMSSLNRLGCTWVGKHSGLLTDVLRKEWGFIGLVETDSATGLYMRLTDARAEAVVAGNDLWLRGAKGDELWQGYESNATVASALRESAHRILYTVLNSFAMDGVSAGTRYVPIVPWYYGVLTAAQVITGVLTGICLAFAVASYLYPFMGRKRKSKEE